MFVAFMALIWANAAESRPVDYGAYTIGEQQLRLGLVRQQYGLLDNVQVQTLGAAWLLGFPNLGGKVTAVETEHLAFSLESNRYVHDLSKSLGVPGGRANIRSIEMVGTWHFREKWNLSMGNSWIRLEAEGQVALDDLLVQFEDMLQVNLLSRMEGYFDDMGSLYAGASLLLQRGLFSLDYKLSDRDTLQLVSRTYTSLSGRVDAGYETSDADLQVGAAASFEIPINEAVSTISTLSWQRDWSRLHLRLGIVLPVKGQAEDTLIQPLGWAQAISIWWLL